MLLLGSQVSMSGFFSIPWGMMKERGTDSFFIFHTSIVAHHRRSGQAFTQDQEEMILIGAFGLFWFGKSQLKSILYFGNYCTVSVPYSERSDELAFCFTAE
jgi:hypothetical protein